MKHVALFTAGILLATSLASAQGLSKEAKIERLLDVTNGQATMNQVFEQMKTAMAPAIPANATPEQRAKAQELQSKILDLMKSQMSWEKVRPAYVKAYSETFSEEEINGILAFYESPAGRAMQAKMPMFISKVMALAQAQASELMPEIQRITRDSLGK
jgi:uncharacterized protein